MDSSIIQAQKERLRKSIDQYSITHGINIHTDIIVDANNALIVTITTGGKKKTESFNVDDLSKSNDTNIEQIIERFIRNLYEPRPPRAPTP